MTWVRSKLRYTRAVTQQLMGTHWRNRQRLDGSCAAVLTYHRVLPQARAHALSVEPGMFVTPSTFRRQLEWLSKEFSLLPLGEILDRFERGAPLPKRAVALTFDDGWRDFYEYAWPELRRAEAPATVFLVTDRVGTGGAFWPDEAWRRLTSMEIEARHGLCNELGVSHSADPAEAVLEYLKQTPEDAREIALDTLRRHAPKEISLERELLNWEEVAELARAGIDFESHTRTHAICRGLPAARLADELQGSLRQLRERGLARNAVLAYPSGGYDDRAREACAAAGYRAALTTRRGLASADQDPWTLPRLGLHEDISSTRPEFRRIVPGFATV